MNISSLTSSTRSLSSVTATSATSSTQGTSASEGTGSGSDNAKLSKMGSLISRLQSLDPEKAKAVLSKIATALKDKADASGDRKMAALADKFADAAKTGDHHQCCLAG